MTTRHFLEGAAVGAGLVYFLDPAQGAARRARLGERLAAPPVPHHYGARLGDLEGLEAANLGSRSGPRTDIDKFTRMVAGAMATYGLARRGGDGGSTPDSGTRSRCRIAAHTGAGTRRAAPNRRYPEEYPYRCPAQPSVRLLDFAR